MNIAHDVRSRSSFCPRPPLQGLDYHGECRPAGEVSGDFFDFVPVEERGLVVSLGDISGDGLSLAILTSGVHGLLRGLSCSGPANLSDVVRQVNRTLCDISPDNVYGTLFYAYLDSVRRRLHYVSAGHEPALLVRRDEARVRRLGSTGTVLGLTARTAYEKRSIPLDAGDVLVAFTDGITEAEDAAGRELCETGVLRVVRDHPDARAVDLVGEILEEVERYTGDAGPSDDRTVLVARFLGTEEERRLDYRSTGLTLAVA